MLDAMGGLSPPMAFVDVSLMRGAGIRPCREVPA